jgi:AcrR family transcriptional regulator
MSLRERKKQQTLEALHGAALRLFDEQGFDATTVADIAAAADVSPATFFNYFPTKEAAVWGDAPGAAEALRTRLRERDAGVPALAVVREWIEGLAGWLEPRVVVQLRLRDQVPQVLAAHLQILDRIERDVAAAVAVDLGADVGDPRPRLVAAIAVTAFLIVQELAIQEYTEQGHFPTREQLDGVLDDMLTFTEGGLAALGGPAKGATSRRRRAGAGSP